MTAVELLRRASEEGLTVFVRGFDRIVVRGRADLVEALRPEFAAHKPEIVAVLREHGCSTATDAVIAAQRLLRKRLWPETAPKDCAFFIGRPVDLTCKRCGSTWQEHTRRATVGDR